MAPGWWCRAFGSGTGIVTRTVIARTESIERNSQLPKGRGFSTSWIALSQVDNTLVGDYRCAARPRTRRCTWVRHTLRSSHTLPRGVFSDRLLGNCGIKRCRQQQNECSGRECTFRLRMDREISHHRRQDRRCLDSGGQPLDDAATGLGVVAGRNRFEGPRCREEAGQ